MKTFVALVLLLLSAASLQAQSVVGPDTARLKGLRRIFVDAGPKNRELITRELAGSKLGFEFLPSREGAEVVLFFASEKLRTPTTVETRPSVTTGTLPDKPEVIYEDIEHGTGMAYAPMEGGGGRVLFRWEGRRKLLARSATKFADAFVKEYKRANARR